MSGQVKTEERSKSAVESRCILNQMHTFFSAPNNNQNKGFVITKTTARLTIWGWVNEFILQIIYNDFKVGYLMENVDEYF